MYDFKIVNMDPKVTFFETLHEVLNVILGLILKRALKPVNVASFSAKQSFFI